MLKIEQTHRSIWGFISAGREIEKSVVRGHIYKIQGTVFTGKIIIFFFFLIAAQTGGDYLWREIFFFRELSLIVEIAAVKEAHNASLALHWVKSSVLLVKKQCQGDRFRMNVKGFYMSLNQSVE